MDAGVLRIIDDTQGLALSCGCNPAHVEADPYNGGAGTVIENAMNLAAVGARPIALVDCLNFGNPERAEIFYQFKQASFGLGDAARKLETPVVGGNVSFYNESDEFGSSIAPTPSIGMVGWVRDLGTIPAGTFRHKDETVILVGDTKDELGASEYYSILGLVNNGVTPGLPGNFDTLIDTLIRAVESGLITAAHDISNGGLAVTLCEMVEQMGAEIDITGICTRDDDALFSESYARMVITTSEPDKVLDMMSGIDYTILGKTGGDGLSITTLSGGINLSIDEINDARSSLSRLMTD
jgi:phosphoribosylformylglycinamidine (FGAM) synthase-like enzyme